VCACRDRSLTPPGWKHGTDSLFIPCLQQLPLLTHHHHDTILLLRLAWAFFTHPVNRTFAECEERSFNSTCSKIVGGEAFLRKAYRRAFWIEGKGMY